MLINIQAVYILMTTIVISELRPRLDQTFGAHLRETIADGRVEKKLVELYIYSKEKYFSHNFAIIKYDILIYIINYVSKLCWSRGDYCAEVIIYMSVLNMK